MRSSRPPDPLAESRASRQCAADDPGRRRPAAACAACAQRAQRAQRAHLEARYVLGELRLQVLPPVVPLAVLQVLCPRGGREGGGGVKWGRLRMREPRSEPARTAPGTRPSPHLPLYCTDRQLGKAETSRPVGPPPTYEVVLSVDEPPRAQAGVQARRQRRRDEGRAVGKELGVHRAGQHLRRAVRSAGKRLGGGRGVAAGGEGIGQLGGERARWRRAGRGSCFLDCSRPRGRRRCRPGMSAVPAVAAGRRAARDTVPPARPRPPEQQAEAHAQQQASPVSLRPSCRAA